MTRRSAEIRLDGLLRTACSVISERGLANTRTADVASAAGVSQALLFYHFATKERLVARAFAYAAEQELARLEAALRPADPLDRLRRLLRQHLPAGRSTAWTLWIDGWSEAARSSELAQISRRLDLRRREALAQVIDDGVSAGVFKCADPDAAAGRIAALIDGLAVQLTVHQRALSRRQAIEWVRAAAARELDVDPDQLA